jgi:hypothetical protein
LKAQVGELKAELAKVRDSSEQKGSTFQKRVDELTRALTDTDHANHELREELMRYQENELSVQKHLLLEDEKYKEMVRA